MAVLGKLWINSVWIVCLCVRVWQQVWCNLVLHLMLHFSCEHSCIKLKYAFNEYLSEYKIKPKSSISTIKMNL